MRRRLTVAVAGLAIAGAIGGTGIAGAAPTTPPAPHHAYGTSCTVGQVEKALSAQDPHLWQQINSHPKLKKHFEEMLLLSPAQRKELRDKERHDHPNRSAVVGFRHDRGAGAQQRKATHQAVEKALHTCSRY
ncbi:MULTISPECIES: hemophore-related protein [Gordonia]|uniref:hemophore-related protein n=1 Tax=Gordonia TaxID=2053 RepID=UPI001FD5BDBA|nr:MULTISPECIES: hemophore-related protein [Gordonia]WLP89717.1 hemophore-related protein [Gordonia sp. NB41Y]